MARLLHSVAVPEQLIAADGVFQFDLAVNPLSVVLLCLRPLNDTGTLANFASYLNVAGALNRVGITHLGESIVQMSGRDAAAMAYFRHGIVPTQATHISTTNFRRCVVLPILLGKFPYDATSCFPASRRGELVLELDIDIADTGYDGLRLSVETIELLDAKPKEFERKVTQTQTFAATGDNDIDLTPGHKSRGVLLFGTTGFVGAVPAPSLGRMQLLLDNQQAGYAATDFEVAHTLGTLWGRQPPSFDNPVLHVDATGGAVEPTFGPMSEIGSAGWQNYSFLDLDPTKDDMLTIDTRGASRYTVRVDAETANLVRAINIEVVPTAGR